MKFFICKVVILVILIYSANGNPLPSNNIDSLKHILAVTKKDNIAKIELLLKISEALIDNGRKESVTYSDMAYRIADSLNNDLFRAKSLKLTGNGWQNWGNNSKALEYLLKSKEIFFKINRLNEYAEVIRNIGETYRASGNLNESINELHEAQILFLKINDSIGLSKTYNRLAATYYEKHSQIKEFIDNGQNLMDKKIQYFDLYKKNVQMKSNYDSTIKYIELSNKIAEAINLVELKISTNLILGSLYTGTYQLDKSYNVYKQTLQYIYDNNVISEMPLALYDFAGWYYNNGDCKKALEYGLKSYDISQKYDYKVYQFLSAGILNLIYKRLGNYKVANNYLELYYENRLEYFKNNIEATIVTINYENELKSKEKEIDFSKKNNRVIIITSFSIILITVSFLFLFIRKNKKEQFLNAQLISKNEIITEQKEKLEEVNIEKDKFFSIIAHDLRNPLGTFKLITEMMHDTPEDFPENERIEYMKLMKDSANNVYSLLENLLEWSRSQRGKISFNPVLINMYDITKLTLDILIPTAINKKITLVNNLPLQLYLNADPNLVTTVIRNLISNAIKFSPEGGTIEVGNSFQPSEGFKPLEGCVVIYVKDNGVGMTEDTIKKLFRIDESITSKGTAGESGTGLGLILCKEFIEMHGGKIWVESKTGKGSTFYFSLKEAK